MSNLELRRVAESALAATADQAWPAALYIVATPIGNLADLSLRAVACLARAGLIACEDTRVASKLLGAFGIEGKRLARADAHTEADVVAQVHAAIEAGQLVAYVSDAGTPGISDPGTRLASALHASGQRVIPLPGASAVLALVQACGLGQTHFEFLGFAPSKGQALEEWLSGLLERPCLSVFFESPQRVESLLARIAARLQPQREIALGRELTKRFEAIRKLQVCDLPTFLQTTTSLQGEWVIALGPAPVETPSADLHLQHDVLLATLLPHLPLKTAVSVASQICGAGRNLLYERALMLRKAAEPPEG